MSFWEELKELAGPVLGAVGIGSQIYGATQDKTEVKQLPKMSKQQRTYYNYLLQQAFSRLGYRVQTPQGKMFVYDPQPPPEYPLPRVAPLTGLQQQGIQGAFDLGNLQTLAMQGGGPDYMEDLSRYQPGDIQKLAEGRGQPPKMQTQPYQFNEMALTGMGPGRPEIPPPERRYFGNWKTPYGYTELPGFATGGFMPDAAPSSINLVGEAGPELHIGQGGQQNMVGEHGPELFDPNQGGYVVPNQALPPSMQGGQGPQENTGQEFPLPGPQDAAQTALDSIARALLQPAMTMAGAGRQEGGPTTDTEKQPFDWSGMDWQMGEQGQWTAPAGEYTPEYFSGGQDIYDVETPDYLNYNYGMDQYEMAPETTPYAPPTFKGWGWQQPTAEQTGQAMYAPPGYTYPAAPPPAPPAEPAQLPQLDFAVDPTQLPQQTGAEWWQTQYPQYWDNLQQMMTDPQAAYTHDPRETARTWQESVFQPGMEAWQEDVAPWLKEQFAATGNVLGSEMPRYLTRKTQQFVTGMNAELARMQQEGRTMQAQSLENMYNRQMQAGGMIASLTALPSQAMHTQALIGNIQNEIQMKQIQLPYDLQQSLGNINLTYAGVDQIYDRLSISNPAIADSQKIDNIIKLAYLDSMQGTALRQQVDTIGAGLDNIMRMMAIAQPEQMTVQNILTMTYEDWARAVGPENLETATSYLINLLGLPTAQMENLMTVPQSYPMDWSWIGNLLAQQQGE